jgi:hypothetical protein
VDEIPQARSSGGNGRVQGFDHRLRELVAAGAGGAKAGAAAGPGTGAEEITCVCMAGDITGLTGMRIITAILAGERNPSRLAALRDGRNLNLEPWQPWPRTFVRDKQGVWGVSLRFPVKILNHLWFKEEAG